MIRLSVLLLLSFVVGAQASASTLEVEKLLHESLQAVRVGQLTAAERAIDRLLQRYPNHRLAHLIKGDLLLARSKPLSTLGDIAEAPADRLQELRAEAVVRSKHWQHIPPQDHFPQYLWQLEPEQPYALLVDAARSRLYVFENIAGEPKLKTDFYVTLGKQGSGKTREGDQKTPLGVYHITGSVPKHKLSDFYGSGAFPLSYPNEWDRRHRRNGHGIWLHGVPRSTYNRAPLASDGCVVMSNPDFDALAEYVQTGHTPVIIADQLQWIDRHTWRQQSEGLRKRLEQWRQDWESRDLDRYLRHYSAQFTSNEQDYAVWVAHKRSINRHKTWVKVNLSRLNIIQYPGPERLAVVSFEQNYQSNNFQNMMVKRQYWQHGEHGWQIIYEGPVTTALSLANNERSRIRNRNANNRSTKSRWS